MGPELSDDVYRYLWEGRVIAEGGNPYVTAPSDDSLEPLRAQDGAGGVYWERINNKDIPAIYPPTVQWALVAAVWITPHPWGMGLVFAAFDVAAFLALWAWLARSGRSPSLAVVYGWCPLLALEFAGEAHSDAAVNAFLAVSLWFAVAARPVSACASLALATAAKLYPLALLPFVLRDLKARGVGGHRLALGVATYVGVLVGLYLPFVPDDPMGMLVGTTEYAARWRSNETLYAVFHAATRWLHEQELVQWIDPWDLLKNEVQRYAKLPVALAAVLLLAVGWWRKLPAHQMGFAFVAFAIACSPTVHPWYVGLMMLWVPGVPRWGLLTFTGTAFLAYHVLPAWLGEGRWQENPWIRVPEYLPFYIGLAVEPYLAHRRERIASRISNGFPS